MIKQSQKGTVDKIYVDINDRFWSFYSMNTTYSDITQQKQM